MSGDIQERRAAYRDRKQNRTAYESDVLERFKAAVEKRIEQKYPGCRFCWSEPEDEPVALRVDVDLRGYRAGAVLPYEMFERPDVYIDWLVDGLSHHLKQLS